MYKQPYLAYLIHASRRTQKVRKEHAESRTRSYPQSGIPALTATASGGPNGSQERPSPRPGSRTILREQARGVWDHLPSHHASSVCAQGHSTPTRKLMSVITRLQEGAWDILGTLAICDNSVKRLPPHALEEKANAMVGWYHCQSSGVPRRKQPIPEKEE